MTGDGHNGFEYPYKAISPVDGQSKEFFSIDDQVKDAINKSYHLGCGDKKYHKKSGNMRKNGKINPK